MIAPESLADLANAVREIPRLLPVGGLSKPALHRTGTEEAQRLSLRGFAGIVEYLPSEFTVTARAGTPLRALNEALAAHGQYLPADPPLAAEGATVGGAVAAGLGGPGSYRFGGLRDFILGVAWVDGTGSVLRAGGKVVKNAAGFDLPKFFVGSLGRFGVLAEITFKVFPRPERRLTFRVRTASVPEAVTALGRAASGPWELDACEVETDPPAWVGRFAGAAEAVDRRLQRFRSQTGQECEALDQDQADALWESRQRCPDAPAGSLLVKAPVTRRQIPALEDALGPLGWRRHYGLGGQSAWISGSDGLAGVLTGMDLTGLVLRGDGLGPWIGAAPPVSQAVRAVQRALDPGGRFCSWPPPRTGHEPRPD